VDGASADVLAAEFSDVLEGSSARLAATAIARCRAAALDGLTGNAEAEVQYLAMVYLIAAQSLTMSEFEGAVVRAALAAVQPPLAYLSA
jgi:hypothetical protein